jgi:hypothetical protein
MTRHEYMQKIRTRDYLYARTVTPEAVIMYECKADSERRDTGFQGLSDSWKKKDN